MKLREMTNHHIVNAIRYWKRELECQPQEAYYMGDSEYAESAVECENRHNRELAENISNLIKRLVKEAKKRKLNL